MKTEGFQCLTCDSEVIESLEELERQELEASLRAPLPFSLRPYRRSPVHCAVTYHAGPFLKLPLAYCSGFGSHSRAPSQNRPANPYLSSVLSHGHVPSNDRALYT